MEWLENGHPGVFLPMNRKKSERPSRAFQKLDVRLLAISRTDLLLNHTKLTSDFFSSPLAGRQAVQYHGRYDAGGSQEQVRGHDFSQHGYP